MLALTLFIAVAKATTFFPNATTTVGSSQEESQSITKSPTLTSQQPSPQSATTTDTTYPQCVPQFQDCSRSGQPFYPSYETEFMNPFVDTTGVHNYSEAKQSLVNYCSGVWESQLQTWFSTAPITYGKAVPATTISESFTGEVVTETLPGSPYSTSSFLTTATYDEYTSVRPAETTETLYLVNSVGVQEPETIYDNPVTSTFTNAYISYGTITSVWTIDGEAGSGPTIAAHTTASYVDVFSYHPTSPCCSSCTLYGGDVQVYYWPTPNPMPKISTLVNSKNFTFISPSIYVAFKSLYATDLCGTVDNKVITATTLAFSEGELSTDYAYEWNTADYPKQQPYLPPIYTQATFGDHEGSCSYITKSFYETDYFTQATSFAPQYSSSGHVYYHYTVSYNPCSPTIAVPTELFSINTAYTGCIQGIAGLYDPPIALSAGNGLAAFSNTPAGAAPTTASTTSANPGPSVAPTTPTPTVTAIPVDPTSTLSQNDPPAQSGSSDPPVQSSSNNSPAQSSSATGASDPSQPLSSNPPAQSPTPSPSDPAQSPTPSPNTPSQSLSPSLNDPSSAPDPQSKAGDPGSSSDAPPISSPSVGNGSPAPSSTPDNNNLLPLSPTPGSSSPPAPSLTPTSTPSAPAIITIDSSILTADSASAFIIASQTLTPGGQITLSSTILSLDPSASFLAIGSSTQTLSHVDVTPVSKYVIGSQTLAAGSPAITVSGTLVSLMSGGKSVVVSSTTQAIAEFIPTMTAIPNSASEYVVGSQTLKPGAPGITVSGTVVSLMSGGASVVVGGSTQAITEFVTTATGTATGMGMGGIIATIGGFGDGSGAPTGTATASYVQISPGGGGGSVYNGTMVTNVGSRMSGMRSVWLMGCVLGAVVVGIGLL